MRRRSFLKGLAGLPLIGGALVSMSPPVAASRWFQHSSGTLVAVGHDGKTGAVVPDIISWNDPSTGSWDADATNQAGKVCMPFKCELQDIREVAGGIQIKVPDYSIVMLYVGGPYIWQFLPTQTARLPYSFTEPGHTHPITDPGHSHGIWYRV